MENCRCWKQMIGWMPGATGVITKAVLSEIALSAAGAITMLSNLHCTERRVHADSCSWALSIDCCIVKTCY